MNYHDELLARIAGAISGEVRCDRKTRRRILKDLKTAALRPPTVTIVTWVLLRGLQGAGH